MYRNHAAREDTIIFPAWKQTLTGKQLDEMNEKFEDIERDYRRSLAATLCFGWPEQGSSGFLATLQILCR